MSQSRDYAKLANGAIGFFCFCNRLRHVTYVVLHTYLFFRLRQPQDGLFMGTVDAYDTSNNTYRIRFDRESLGTQSVPDEDVVSAGELETLPLSTFTVPKPRPQRPIIGINT